MIRFYTIFLLVFLSFFGNAFGEEKDMRKTFYSKAFEVLADGFADYSNSDPMFTGTLYTQDVAVSVCGSKNYCDLVAERKMDLSRLETVLEN